jgi:NADH:ubiquinone oxidoreductase subunit D
MQGLLTLIESNMVTDVVGNIGSIDCVMEEANR